MSKSWVDVQKKTFTRWANEFLSERMLEIGSLEDDLQDGWLLLNLLEVISSQTIGGSKKCKSKFQKMENLNRALAFIQKEGLKLVGIGAEDIHDGNTKLILGMMWTLILRYQINLGEGSPKWELLQWVKEQVKRYDVEAPRNFAKDWTDGKVLFALVDSLIPGTRTEDRDMGPAEGDATESIEGSMQAALETYDIPRILDVADMAEQPDELAVMTYISYYREWASEEGQRKRQAELDALKNATAEHSFADGPGLEKPETCQDQAVFVHARNTHGNPLEPAHGGDDFKVVLSGPEDVECTLTDKGDGEYETSYNVNKPGEYTIAVTLGEEHIKDSPFTVRVVGPVGEFVEVTGPGVEGGEASAKSEFVVTAFDADGTRVTTGGDAFSASVKGPSGDEVACELVDNEDGTWSGSYGGEAPGTYEVSVLLNDEHVKDSPFSALLENASAGVSWAEGEGLSEGQATVEATFVIHAVAKNGDACTEGGDPFVVEVANVGETAAAVADNGDGTYTATFTPGTKGEAEIAVTLHGEPIKDAPFTAHIRAFPSAEASYAEGAGLSEGQATKEGAFDVHAVEEDGTACEEGGDEFSSVLHGPDGDKDVQVTDNGDGTYACKYTPELPGDYTLDVLLRGEHVKDSPFSFAISSCPDPDRTYAEGEGLTDVWDNEPAVFTIHAIDLQGEPRTEGGDVFVVKVVSDDEGELEATVVDNDDGTYTVTYEPQEPAKATIDVTYEDAHIKDSPFTVEVKEGTDASNTGIGKQSFTVTATDRRGRPKTFGGDKMEVSFDGPEDGESEVEVEDHGDGTYTATYVISKGKWQIHCRINGKAIKPSPFKVRI